jgi:predicted ArsR family transcriptional regulator
MIMTARQKVLAYLRKNQPVSADQIGRALNMSSANARHHLSVLSSDGRCSVVGKQPVERRGRPLKLYGLSENLQGNNLALLSGSVLDQWLQGIPAASRDDAIRKLAGHLIPEMGPPSPHTPMAKRLVQIVEKLNGLKYQARWEAGSEGPRVIFGHCPYAAIIQEHPELCKMDGALLELIMGQSAQQMVKIGEKGSRICVFRVR